MSWAPVIYQDNPLSKLSSKLNILSVIGTYRKLTINQETNRFLSIADR